MDEQNITEIQAEEIAEEATPYEEVTEETSESIESLKAEIESLKETIRQKNEQQERLTRELGEFSELFPEIPPSEIPEEILN